MASTTETTSRLATGLRGRSPYVNRTMSKNNAVGVSDSSSSSTESETVSSSSSLPSSLSYPSSADAAAGIRTPIGEDKGSSGGEMEHLLHQKLESHAVGPPLALFGINLSTRFSRTNQFVICAGGVFFFTLLYGYLQELLSVKLFNRDLALFLASAQFFGYTAWSYALRTLIRYKGQQNVGISPYKANGLLLDHYGENAVNRVPTMAYIGLSLIRAVDLGMTNSAMRYINYPAKTLVKSSRVIFTMIVGSIVSRKRYTTKEYFNVFLMVTGLVIFLHADASRAAIFQPIGVIMLFISLTCDGFITNWSETIMRRYNVEQDEFIFRLYSIALLAITFVAYLRGEISRGIEFLSTPGTLDEITEGRIPTWTVSGKLFVIFMFSTSGFFGSSAAAAITKHFGALPMSITSTARKATTLFISFALFNNDCSLEHVAGVLIFIVALLMKTFGKQSKTSENNNTQTHEVFAGRMTPSMSYVHMEMAVERGGREVV